MEDFDHLLCEKHLNNETLELISAGKFKEIDSFFSKISCNIFSGNFFLNFAFKFQFSVFLSKMVNSNSKI